MKSFLKTNMREITHVVDAETGEVLETDIKSHKYLANTKEEFFLCYSAIIGLFMEMSQAEIRIFGYCLKFAKGVKFDISKKVRLSMSAEIDIHERVILNNIPNLISKGLLFQHADGLYQINPRYAYQGSSDNRNKELKAIIELGCIDC